MRTRTLIVVALLILSLSAIVAAQSVTFAGAQTTVPASGLSYLFSIAVNKAGDVFIADFNNQRVVKVPAGGGPQTTVGTGLISPFGVAVNKAGDVFIADVGLGQVVEVPVGGGPQTTVGSGLYYPSGVAVDGAGDVFIADAGNTRVVEVPAGGGAQITVPATGLAYPWGVAVDGPGNIFIADLFNSQVVKVPAGGGPQTTVGSGVFNPYGVAVDTAGDVFIADYGNGRVLEIPAGGGPQTTVPDIGLSYPVGVAVDGAGDVFVSDSNNKRVVEVQRIAVNFGNANICPGGQTTPAPCSQTFTLNYNVYAPTTFGIVNVFTQGAPNLDFTLSSSTCTGTQTSGSSCTVVVTFAPRAPGLRMGGVQLMDSSGNLLVTTMVHGVGQGPAIAFGPGAQPTVGSGLSSPYGVAVDAAGDVFIADTGNRRVVEVPAGGSPQITVGSGLNSPFGLALDGAGDVFISDTVLNQVVEVQAGGALQTTVGTGLLSPYGVAVDGAGNVFISDTGNSRVVEVPAGGGPQTTVASPLTPFGLAVDGAGDLFIVDRYQNNDRVVEIPAGGGPQITVASGLNNPLGVAVDGAGDVFIGDSLSGRVVEAPAGGGPQITVGSQLSNPFGVAVDGTGNVFIADYTRSYVIEVQRAQPPTLSFAATGVGNTSADSPQSVTMQNIGSQPLIAVTPGLLVGGPNFLQVAGPGAPADCTGAFSLSPGASCNLSISFSPQTTGSLVSAATFTDNALNAAVNSTSASQSLALRGTATQGSQTITFGVLPNQALGAVPFTLSAAASSGLAVSFSSATPAVCTTSVATVALVAAGTCTVQATQAGNVNYTAAAPVNQSFQVTQESQTITFGALTNQSLGTVPFTLSAAASSGLAVSFSSTTPAVCTTSVATVALVAAGTCTVQATQAGNVNYVAATPINQSFQVSDFVLTSNPTSASTPAGQAGTFMLTVTPQGSFASPISLSCSGLPSMAGCTFTPSATVTPNASTVTTTLNITTAPHTTSAALGLFGHHSGPLYAIWLLLPAVLLGMVGMAAPKGRKRLSYAVGFLLVSVCLSQTACGGASPGVNPTTGTPAGTYSVMVTGVAGNNERPTTIRLTVH
jgi:sugar lactone lactonase YvrE